LNYDQYEYDRKNKSSRKNRNSRKNKSSRKNRNSRKNKSSRKNKDLRKLEKELTRKEKRLEKMKNRLDKREDKLETKIAKCKENSMPAPPNNDEINDNKRSCKQSCREQQCGPNLNSGDYLPVQKECNSSGGSWEVESMKPNPNIDSDYGYVFMPNKYWKIWQNKSLGSDTHPKLSTDQTCKVYPYIADGVPLDALEL